MSLLAHRPRFTSVALTCALSGAAGGCVAAPPASTTVPSVWHHELIFVELRDTSDRALLALLDTGANASAIDAAVAAELESRGRVDVVGTTGVVRSEVVRVEGLRFGALELPALDATRRPLDGLLAPAGRQVDLILGSDALVGRALTLDFEAETVSLGPGEPAATEDGVTMILDAGIPAVDSVIGGIEAWLRIDTGASLFATDDVYVNVPTALWEELRACFPGLAPTGALLGTGADGSSVELPVVPIDDVRIGPRRLQRAFLIVQPRAGYFSSPDAKGFVGNNFLRSLGCVTLDYAAGRLRVGP